MKQAASQASPTAAGRLGELLRTAIERSVVPGAVGAVLHGGRVAFHEAHGWAATEPERLPMTIETLFDLASMTKPLATAAMTLALADRGALSLDDHLAEYLPEYSEYRDQGITLRRILAHCSGLPGWRPLFAGGEDVRRRVRDSAAWGLSYEPGTRVEYSCVGYVCLGIALERIADRSLDTLFAELLAAPLGLKSTCYGPLSGEVRVAATERDNAFERAVLQRAGLQFPAWRTGIISGEVQDGNAHYGLGGVSGNAGLFSTAMEVAQMGAMWLRGGTGPAGQVLSEAAVNLARQCQGPALGARRGLGWARAAPGGPSREELAYPPSNARFFPEQDCLWIPRSFGEYASTAAFGHTGFTGTSICVDPTRDVVVVLLTNAVHPHVPSDTAFARLRARFHNLVFATDWEEASSEDAPRARG